jgi:hypothetical protein
MSSEPARAAAAAVASTECSVASALTGISITAVGRPGVVAVTVILEGAAATSAADQTCVSQWPPQPISTSAASRSSTSLSTEAASADTWDRGCLTD